MKHLPLLPLSAFCLTLAGCATQPRKASEARPVDPGRHYADFTNYEHPKPHGAKVIVVRDKGYLGSGVKAKIAVDGRALTGLWSSERVDFYLPAGDHILSVEPVPQLGGGVVEHSFNFRADQTLYFRVSILTGGFDIQPTTQIQ